jgi:hypothetical protein
VRLLKLEIHEPLPGKVLPEMGKIVGPDEAARRYRAIATTTLLQLRGLAETRLRLIVSPVDASEAIRFWLLPKLAERWEFNENTFSATGFEIDFSETSHDFEIEASGEILCPHLGARWVHTAMLGLGRTVNQVVGPAENGGEYFRASVSQTGLAERILPALPVIRSDADWHGALESAVGPALKKAWEHES